MIQPTDIQIGMYLNNDGTTAIPVYRDEDSMETPIYYVQPQELIGQVVDISHGNGGVVINFHSDAITSHQNFIQQAFNYINAFIPGDIGVNYGSVKFSDLQNNVGDAQIQSQRDAIQIAANNGVSLQNMFIKTAKGVAQTIESSIPWELPVAFVAGYVLLNWKNFFKPVNIKK